MKKHCLILILLILTNTRIAQAADRFYAGFALGETKVSDWCNRTPRHCDDSDVGLKLFGGFQFTAHWGIEASYVDFGQITLSEAQNGTPGFRAEVRGFTLSGMGILPLSKKLDFFARAGLFRWEVELARFGTLATQTLKRDGTDFTFGIGFAFLLTQAVQLRLEWEQFTNIGDQNTSDIDLFSGGMLLFF